MAQELHLIAKTILGAGDPFSLALNEGWDPSFVEAVWNDDDQPIAS